MYFALGLECRYSARRPFRSPKGTIHVDSAAETRPSDAVNHCHRRSHDRLAACGVVNTLIDGFKHAKAVEEDLEQATGLKRSACPGEVGSGSPTRTCANMGIYSGFNCNNGRLLQVTVMYPRLHDAKSMRDLAEAARGDPEGIPAGT
jgi:hypothetical protein